MTDRDRLVERGLRRWAGVMGMIWMVGPFVAAGTLRWPAIWVYLGVVHVAYRQRVRHRLVPGLW